MLYFCTYSESSLLNWSFLFCGWVFTDTKSFSFPPWVFKVIVSSVSTLDTHNLYILHFFRSKHSSKSCVWQRMLTLLVLVKNARRYSALVAECHRLCCTPILALCIRFCQSLLNGQVVHPCQMYTSHERLPLWLGYDLHLFSNTYLLLIHAWLKFCYVHFTINRTMLANSCRFVRLLIWKLRRYHTIDL